MSGSPPARPLSAVDAEISSLLTLNRDAEQQIASIADEMARLLRDLATLEQHRDYLIVAVTSRARKLDRLLDERLSVRLREQAEAVVISDDDD